MASQVTRVIRARFDVAADETLATAAWTTCALPDS